MIFMACLSAILLILLLDFSQMMPHLTLFRHKSINRSSRIIGIHKKDIKLNIRIIAIIKTVEFVKLHNLALASEKERLMSTNDGLYNKRRPKRPKLTTWQLWLIFPFYFAAVYKLYNVLTQTSVQVEIL